MTRKDHGRIVGHIEPLVRVDGKTVGQLHDGHEMAESRRARGKAAKGGVDVQPEGKVPLERGNGT